MPLGNGLGVRLKMLTAIMNGLINVAVWIMEGAFLLLPDTPFHFEKLDWGEFGKAIGYVFPLVKMATSFIAILTAVGTYYAVRTLLRWVKMVQ